MVQHMPVDMPLPVSASTVVPPRRRRKTRLACISCRIRKTGCDGNRPVCATCVVRGQPDQCVYQGDNRRSHPASQTNSPILSQSGPPAVVPPTQIRSITNQRPSHPRLSPSSSGLGGETLVHVSSSDDEGAVFGPSSNYAFIRQVAATVAVPSRHEMAQQPSSSRYGEQRLINDSIGFPVVDDTALSQDFDAVMLPERPASNMLLQAYWRYVHPLLPILHRPSVTQTYEDLWQPAFYNPQVQRKRISFHAILNMMFALGSQHCELIPPEKRKKDAATFYKRSLRLLSVEMLDTYTMEVVQLLLLRTLYLQYAPHSVRCWTTCGVSVRAAQGLALHVDKPEENQLKREMRRRLWYGVLILDRFAATSSGWPVSTSISNSVPLPMEIDEEYILESGEGQQPGNVPSQMSFFNQYAKLAVNICTDILEKVYTYVSEQPDTNTHTTYYHYLRDVPDMCSRLDDFLENLPPHLKHQNRSCGNSELDECFRMQSEILRQRALYVRLLVLRPCVLTSVTACMRELNTVKSQSSVACLIRGSAMKDLTLLGVSTAHIIIDELHLSRQPPTWHTVRMAFGAIIVLLAASLIPEFHVDFGSGPGKLSWNKILDIFEAYKAQDQAAESGLKALWKYHDQFKAAGKGGHPADVVETTTADSNGTPSSENTIPILDESWLSNMAKEFANDFPMGEFQYGLLDSTLAEWAVIQ